MFENKTVDVDGIEMAYVEGGAGDPIVFLHGNPTSSYLWRNIMPHVLDQGRCIAPDLVGMGNSEALPDSGRHSYRFVEHRKYLDAFFDGIGLGDSVTLVVHDWGSALGFDWANRHRERVKGIAYMEAIVQPVSWSDWPEAAVGIFQGLRSEAGEELALTKNLFVEAILPASILRELTDEEMATYRAPYVEPGESRRPTLTWPREIPIEGEPQDVVEVVSSYAEWLSASEVPKLFVNADPGSILVGSQRDFCRGWPNQSEVTVPGLHFIQEDSPEEIGEAISSWLENL